MSSLWIIENLWIQTFNLNVTYIDSIELGGDEFSQYQLDKMYIHRSIHQNPSTR